METATFSSAIQHLHPIERKPFYHFLPTTKVLTLAAPGCTWACSYCQNYRLSQFGRNSESIWRAEPLTSAALVAECAARSLSIAFSYTEPVLASELTLALAEHARPRGVEILWKTNGFITAPAARQVSIVLSAVNVDLKATDPRAHETLTRAPVKPVLEALELWRAAGLWVEISTPIIPGVNDSDEALKNLARTVVSLGCDTPWHLLRFHPDHLLNHLPPTSPSTLERAREIALAEGLRYVYAERALGSRGRDTCCPNCGNVVVERGIAHTSRVRLNGDACASCGIGIAGVWQKPRTSVSVQTKAPVRVKSTG